MTQPTAQSPLSPADASRSLWFTADALLGQCSDFLDNNLTTDSQLSHSSTLIPGSTMGKHLRQALFPVLPRVDAPFLGHG